MTMANDFQRKLFWVALICFTILQIFGLFHAELRMCLDDFALDIIPFKTIGYFTPKFRYAYILNKMLVVVALYMHLPLRSISIVYCINDALFYISIALAIIILTRRYDYAAVVVVAPVIIQGWAFYEIICELYLSGAIMILFVAVFESMAHSLLRSFILCLCLMLIIWSHPVMMPILLIFFVSLYTDRSKLWQDWKIIAFAIINIVIRLTFLCSYDMNKIKGVGHSDFGIHNFTVSMGDYFISHWPILLCLLLLVIFSETKSQKRNALISVVIFLCMLPMFLSRMCSGQYYAFDKSMYPAHLFILTQLIVMICANVYDIKPTILILLLLLYMTCSSMCELMINEKTYIKRHITFVRKINALCLARSPLQSKWYVINDSLLTSIPFLSSSVKSMYVSAYDDSPVTVQVVYLNSKEAVHLEEVKQDSIFLSTSGYMAISALDSGYFHIRSGKYMRLELDTSLINYWTRQ
jgi:hypothetical protein